MAFAEGLGILLRLELLAEQNSNLSTAFTMYRRCFLALLSGMGQTSAMRGSPALRCSSPEAVPADRMLQTLARDTEGADIDPQDIVELEASLAPIESAFTQPAFLQRVLQRLSAPQFVDLYADGGTAALAGVLR